MKNPYLFLVVFVIGAAVLFLFDFWLTLLVGVVMCVGAVVLGVFAIAEPEFLDGDADK
ncbi:MAG: hypothetical protein JHD02_06770 [Thermoleophilaceae bacterium]|nr:hypothetical protein [Thermoleophilaceae bacterium]